MTICIYKDGVLGTDGRATLGDGTILSDKLKKCGIIWQCSEEGIRSIYPETLKSPILFAAYATAGQANVFNKFLRWFVSVDHPVVDAEIDESFESGPITLDSNEVDISIIVVFKDYDFVRAYSSDYEEQIFVDIPKETFLATGSGQSQAYGINAACPDMSVEDIIKSVSKTCCTCGGDISIIDLNTSQELKLTGVLPEVKTSKITFKEKLKAFLNK